MLKKSRRNSLALLPAKDKASLLESMKTLDYDIVKQTYEAVSVSEWEIKTKGAESRRRMHLQEQRMKRRGSDV